MFKKDNKIHHIWLYTLKLSDDRYYVGTTARKDPFVRIHDHANGKGSKWTRHYPLDHVLEIQDLGQLTWSEAIHEEQLTTQDYMDAYGVNSVRGGFVNKDGSVLYFFNSFFFDSIYKLVFRIIILSIVFIHNCEINLVRTSSTPVVHK